MCETMQITVNSVINWSFFSIIWFMDEKLFIVLNSKVCMYNATTSSHQQVGLLAKMIFSAPGISMAVNWLKT